MRIAYMVNYFPSLSQTFILNQIVGLIDQGHTVDIYAERAASPRQNYLSQALVHQDVIDYNLLKSTYYFNRPKQSTFFAILTGLRIIFTQSIKHFVFWQLALKYAQHSKEVFPVSLLEFIHMAKVFIDQPDYDVIHCHFGPNGVKGAVIRKMLYPNSILATTFHGYDLTKYLSMDKAAFASRENPYRQLFKSGDIFLPISEHWRQVLIEMGCSASRAKVHHMGVDMNRFAAVTPPVDSSVLPPDSDSKIKVLTVARLSEKKGIEYGIRSIQKLISHYPDVEYSIVGEGPLHSELRSLIETLALEQSITLLGGRQQSEIVTLLAQSHIVLAPSVTATDGDQEGIPVVLMEAMAMGVPVVSTLHSGIPELVEDGVSGFLVPEKAVDAMTEKLLRLAKSPHLRWQMGLEGRQYVEKNFDVHTLNRQLGELFETLVTQKVASCSAASTK